MSARLVCPPGASGCVLAAAALGRLHHLADLRHRLGRAGAGRRRLGAGRPPVGPGGAAVGPAPARRPAGPAAAPGALRPFAEVIKDAKTHRRPRSRFWQKDDKVWLELRPEDLGQAVLPLAQARRPASARRASSAA